MSSLRQIHNTNRNLDVVNKAVILAGGKSKRMGKDKAMLGVNSLSMLEFQYQRLEKIFQNVYISSKDNRFNTSHPIIYDEGQNYAPCFGLLSIIDRLKEPFFVLPVDMPFVSEKAIEKIVNTYSSGLDACVGVLNEQIEPLIGIYAPSIRGKIHAAIHYHEYKLLHIIESSKVLFVDFYNEDEFMNLNTPQDYERAMEFIQKQ